MHWMSSWKVLKPKLQSPMRMHPKRRCRAVCCWKIMFHPFFKYEHIVTVPCNYVVNIYVKQIFEVVVVLNVEMLDDDSKWCWSETVKPCWNIWGVPLHKMLFTPVTYSMNILVGGFKLLFNPYLGKWSNLTNIFQMGWFSHQLDIACFGASNSGDWWGRGFMGRYAESRLRVVVL